MLSDEERRLIEEEARCYPDRRAVCIDALRIVQRQRGWISDQALAEVAEHVGMSVEDLEGVATFYSLIRRRPVGRHVILLCDSVSCWLTGYPGIRAHLCRRLAIDFGGTTADGRFTLLPNVCLGRCEYAPVMLVDDDAHDDLTPEKVDRILEDYR
jgi:NADH-quinone oxidoreductase subunit E